MHFGGGDALPAATQDGGRELARPSPQSIAKREREQAKRDKRERKREKKAAAAEARAAQTVVPSGEPAE
jgi:hypothetical protein